LCLHLLINLRDQSHYYLFNVGEVGGWITSSVVMSIKLL